MKIQQQHFLQQAWKTVLNNNYDFEPQKSQLVLAFGSPELIINPDIFNHLKTAYPSADIVTCSTAGEISKNEVHDHSVIATAINLDSSRVRCISTVISNHQNSFETGRFLISQLFEPDINSVFIISDGTYINGSELVSGLNSNNPGGIAITGALAGDGANFSRTFTGLNEVASEGNVIAVGFYGENLSVAHGSVGGWDEFGHERTITKSDKNVLYEIDGKNALDLYKQYLGEYVNDLPGSALLFPLSLKIKGSDQNLVRTILSVNETEKTMIFAGNLPEGSKVRLMKANFDKLIGGSATAASDASGSKDYKDSRLAILISCIGRKLILQERSEEEVEAAVSILGDNTQITGFYSYGEISPFNPGSRCELHNQTMTITTFSEI